MGSYWSSQDSTPDVVALRLATEADVEQLSAIYANPDNQKMSGDNEITKKVLLDWYKCNPAISKCRNLEYFVSSYTVRKHNASVGSVQLYSMTKDEFKDFGGGEKVGCARTNIVCTGFTVDSKYWGQGIASEALKIGLALAKAAGFTKVAAECFSTNAASAKVLEKNGFVRIGTGDSHRDAESSTKIPRTFFIRTL